MEENRGLLAVREAAKGNLARTKEQLGDRRFSSDGRRARNSSCETRQQTRRTTRTSPATYVSLDALLSSWVSTDAVKYPQDESFRFRPPSVASTATSQRSSVRSPELTQLAHFG